jgi:hypothetical protein
MIHILALDRTFRFISMSVWQFLIIAKRIWKVFIVIYTDLEQSEIHAFLHSLPVLNMDAILSRAEQIKFEVVQMI